MDEIGKNLSIVSIVASLALVIVGVFQFAKDLMIKSDTRRQKLFDEYEAERMENVLLKGQIIAYKERYSQKVTEAAYYKTLYRRYRSKYEQLTKTDDDPPPPIVSMSDDETRDDK